MISFRNLVISAFWTALSISSIYAQDLSRYRGFQLGMDLSAAAEQADMKPSQAKLIHQRPEKIQELEWRPYSSLDATAQADSVKEVLFGFFNGQLYRMVVHYDQHRTEGLTEEDLIESISAKYGTPTVPVAKVVSSSSSQGIGDSERVIARWEDPENSINLFHFSYYSNFGLLVYSKRLDALAQAAVVEAIRLDRQEAPQRELERQTREDDEKRAAGQKVRPANKAVFRP
jgi:hypothetical protein